jgi:hypothetical protein
VRWSRENNHNAGLHNFLIFTRWIKYNIVRLAEHAAHM